MTLPVQNTFEWVCGDSGAKTPRVEVTAVRNVKMRIDEEDNERSVPIGGTLSLAQGKMANPRIISHLLGNVAIALFSTCSIAYAGTFFLS